MKTRDWARSGASGRITTTYAYWGEGSGEAATGEMHTISYEDGVTPTVTFT